MWKSRNKLLCLRKKWEWLICVGNAALLLMSYKKKLPQGMLLKCTSLLEFNLEYIQEGTFKPCWEIYPLPDWNLKAVPWFCSKESKLYALTNYQNYMPSYICVYFTLIILLSRIIFREGESHFIRIEEAKNTLGNGWQIEDWCRQPLQLVKETNNQEERSSETWAGQLISAFKAPEILPRKYLSFEVYA